METPLGGVPIFAGMKEDALAVLFQRAESLAAVEGDVIVREGEPGSKFYLIKSGAVRVVKRLETPDEVLLARLGARDFFGEMCILETLPRAATVQAMEASEFVFLPSTAFYQLYQARPEQTAHIPIIAFAAKTNKAAQNAAVEAGAKLVAIDDAVLQQLPHLLEQALEVD